MNLEEGAHCPVESSPRNIKEYKERAMPRVDLVLISYYYDIIPSSFHV